MASDKQIAANRANAQLSSGPTSPEGKDKVSHNAVKTGLTGRTVLLPSDDVEAYQAHVARVFGQFSPETDSEKSLTHSLADSLWRLDRIPALEAGIYAIGRRALSGEFADEQDPANRRAMIDSQIFLTYRRDLNNLSIQGARLQRQCDKDEAELKRQIAERQAADKQRAAAESARWSKAIQNYKNAQRFQQAFDPQEIGFEFSTAEIVAKAIANYKKSLIDCGRYYEVKASDSFHKAA